MPRSQIKRAPDDFFQLRRFKDFRYRPAAVRFLRHFTQTATNQTGIGRQVLQERRACTFHFRKTPRGDWTDIGRRLYEDRMAPTRRPVVLSAAVLLPSIHRTVIVRFNLPFSFNHSLKTDFSIESLRIGIMPSKEKAKKIPLLTKKIQQISWEYNCNLYFKLMNYNTVRCLYTFLQYNDQVA